MEVMLGGVISYFLHLDLIGYKEHPAAMKNQSKLHVR